MKKILFASLLVVILVNCSKKKSDPNPVDNTGTPSNSQCGKLTIKKGSTSFEATNLNNSIFYDNTKGGRRLDIRGSVDGGIFVLSVSNFDFQNPPVDGIKVKTYFNDETKSECKDIGGTSYCDEMLGTFLKDSKTYMTFDEEGDGTITITSIDANKKTVSGTFSFTVETADQSEYIPFSGSFSNVCYSILK